MHLLDGERGCCAFEGGNEVFADGVPACGVVGELLDGVLGVVRLAHQAEVFPDDFFAGAGAQTGEVRVECAPALDACGKFIAVRDACTVEGVRDDDFGFRADADAVCGVKLGGIDFEGLARVGQVPPRFDELAIGFTHRCDECAAARMLLGEGLVKCVWPICLEESVDGRELLLDDGLRRPVVVTLRKDLCLAEFFAREVGPFRVSLLRNDVILVGLSAFVNA